MRLAVETVVFLLTTVVPLGNDCREMLASASVLYVLAAEVFFRGRVMLLATTWYFKRVCRAAFPLVVDSRHEDGSSGKESKRA